MPKKYKNFFQKSQKKIDDLKKKLEDLSQKEVKLQKEEELIRKEEIILAKKAKDASKEVRVVLSIESVFKATFAVLAVVAFVFLIRYIKDVIIIFLVALFLAAAFGPTVNKLQKHKVPRALGIIILYAIVLGIVVLLFTLLIPIIATQITDLALSLRDMLQNIVAGEASESWLMEKLQPLAQQLWANVDESQIFGGITSSLKDLGSRLTSFAGNAIGAVLTIFNGIFNMILVLIITFFMILNRENTSNFFRSLFPVRYSPYIAVKTQQISNAIGEWIRGQVLLALGMGLLTFIAFSILGLDFVLTLALVSAIAEFVPYIGPLITFGSAALIALNQDPVLLVWLIPTYAVVQFIEGNIMVPLIVGRSVGLNPVVILFSLLSGAALGVKIGGSIALGLVGMILAVPVANIISIFVADYTGRNKK